MSVPCAVLISTGVYVVINASLRSRDGRLAERWKVDIALKPTLWLIAPATIEVEPARGSLEDGGPYRRGCFARARGWIPWGHPANLRGLAPGSGASTIYTTEGT